MSRKSKRDYKEQRAFKDAEREAKRKDVTPPAKPIGRMSLSTMPPWQRALVRALEKGAAARRRIDRGE